MFNKERLGEYSKFFIGVKLGNANLNLVDSPLGACSLYAIIFNKPLILKCSLFSINLRISHQI
jgi:hypothetical protein